jgi:beta-lactamase superfamily II metal-dependent hydrolase
VSGRTARGRGVMSIAIAVCAFAWAVCGGTARATPPEYKSIPREQATDPPIDPSQLLRIWVVYVGQGDGILIQLPETMNYDPDPDDDDDTASERIDILIDGGSWNSSDADRIGALVESLYADAPQIVIEHAVISHHDQDHVLGMVRMLRSGAFGFERIYHNGLASYRRDAPRFAGAGDLVAKSPRAMARTETVDGRTTLVAEDLIEDVAAAGQRVGELQGTSAVYRQLIDTVISSAETAGLQAFDRACVGRPFIAEREQDARGGLGEVAIELIWPLEELLAYGGRDWGETINGNSLTFRLTYREFEMLFAGDHNEHSQQAMIAHYEVADPGLSVLDCDVLKVPHHGSSHAIEPFFRRDNEHRRPAVAVASMGSKGFSLDWKHPAEEVISWLGGPHRFYSTYIHEKRFRWHDMSNTTAREAMIEMSHILIETDGEWFRIVEIPAEGGDPTSPPTVQETRRSDGTRWIRAKPE